MTVAVIEQAGDNAPSPAIIEEGAALDSFSDAELDAAILANAKTETAKDPAEGIEDPVATAAAAKAAEEAAAAAKAAEEAAAAAAKTETVTKEEFDKLKKKMENQELFIQRQGTEVGTLRKLRDQLTALAKEKRAQAEEQLLTNPSQAMDTHAEARELEKRANDTGAQEQYEANRAAINAAFPDFEKRIDDIVAASLEMGIPQANLDNFKRDPYATPIATLTPYVRAAVIRKHYLDKATLVDKMALQLKELSAGTTNFTKNLKDAALKSPSIKAAGGGATEGSLGSIDESQIPDLSYAEIERLLKQK